MTKTLEELYRDVRNQLYFLTAYRAPHERQWESEIEITQREEYNTKRRTDWDAETERLISEAIEDIGSDLIGHVVNGRFQCLRCSRMIGCPVYRVNIGIYSQNCSVCGKLIVDGAKKVNSGLPLCLFDPPLIKEDFLTYKEQAIAAKIEEDWEVFARIKKEMVQTLLTGFSRIPTNQITDCVRIVYDMLNQDNPDGDIHCRASEARVSLDYEAQKALTRLCVLTTGVGIAELRAPGNS